jgi:hypothetical protein
MDGLIDMIAHELGLTGVTLLVVMLILSKGCNLLARLIPDNATGFKGLVRRVCVVLGVYASSRVASGVTQADVAKGFVNNGGLVVKRNPLGQFEKVEPILGDVKKG